MAFRGLFDRGSAEPATRSPATHQRAPGTSIGYDPLLISNLRRDHRRLLDIFADAQSLLTTGDYTGVQRKLGELRVTLQDHLLLANTKLYIYVSRQLAADPARTALVNVHRREMLENSREIMDFLRTYSAVRLDDQSAEMFQTELLVIGAALMHRMERDESTLYPLYQASY